jgi:hypothetical protein
MTVKTDIAAVTPTSTARKAFSAQGVSIDNLMAALQRTAGELQILCKQIVAFHPLDSVVSATVNAGGSGGTNGQVTITGTTGTGTRFTARGVISGGALSGALTILNTGSYSVDPTSLTAEPVTGSGLTGATVGLTMSGDNTVLTALSNILAELA